MRTKLGAVLVAALLAALVAAPARADHDPSPPYVASSSPEGRPLYGFHHDQLGGTTHAHAGLQYRLYNGTHQYRPWVKVAGDGRQLAATFSSLTFYAHGFGTWRPADVTKTGTTIYHTTGWHRIYSGQDASMSVNVKVRYIGGASAAECVASYRIRARDLYPVAGPGC